MKCKEETTTHTVDCVRWTKFHPQSLAVAASWGGEPRKCRRDRQLPFLFFPKQINDENGKSKKKKKEGEADKERLSTLEDNQIQKKARSVDVKT